MKIQKSLVDKVRKFLSGNNFDGIKFFFECLIKYKDISPVYMEDPSTISPLPDSIEHTPINLPHPVHFREGMQIRNFMRTCEECKDWTAHDFDNYWISIVGLVMLEIFHESSIIIHKEMYGEIHYSK